MQPVALSTREIFDKFLLVGALEVEAPYIGPGGHFVVADADNIETVRDFFPDGFTAVEVIAGLIHVAKLHGFTDRDLATVRGLKAHQDAEQRRLAHTVGTDNANDAAFGHREAHVFEQQPITKGFPQSADLDHFIAQSRTRRNVDFVGLVAGLELLRIQFLEPLQSRLVFRLPALRVGAHPLEFGLDGFLVGGLMTLFLLNPLFFRF